jgi:hypothetical protein
MAVRAVGALMAADEISASFAIVANDLLDALERRGHVLCIASSN